MTKHPYVHLACFLVVAVIAVDAAKNKDKQDSTANSTPLPIEIVINNVQPRTSSCAAPQPEDEEDCPPCDECPVCDDDEETPPTVDPNDCGEHKDGDTFTQGCLRCGCTAGRVSCKPTDACFQPTCDEAFSTVAGSLSNPADTIEEGIDVEDCLDCAAKCTSLGRNTCKSYECNPVKKKCDLNSSPFSDQTEIEDGWIMCGPKADGEVVFAPPPVPETLYLETLGKACSGQNIADAMVNGVTLQKCKDHFAQWNFANNNSAISSEWTGPAGGNGRCQLSTTCKLSDTTNFADHWFIVPEVVSSPSPREIRTSEETACQGLNDKWLSGVTIERCKYVLSILPQFISAEYRGVDSVCVFSTTCTKARAIPFPDHTLLQAVLPKSSIPAETWMSRIYSDTRLNQLSIPGTHDSASINGAFVEIASWASVTQQLDIDKQLVAGVRFFDIRWDFWDDEKLSFSGFFSSSNKPNRCQMFVVHGPHTTVIPLQAVIQSFVQFLNDHPSEALFVRLQQQAPKANSLPQRHWSGCLPQDHLAPMLKSTGFNNKVLVAPNCGLSNIKMGQARGKIVFMLDILGGSSPLLYQTLRNSNIKISTLWQDQQLWLQDVYKHRMYGTPPPPTAFFPGDPVFNGFIAQNKIKIFLNAHLEWLQFGGTTLLLNFLSFTGPDTASIAGISTPSILGGLANDLLVPVLQSTEYGGVPMGVSILDEITPELALDILYNNDLLTTNQA